MNDMTKEPWVLGGKNWKIIRTDRSLPDQYHTIPAQHGDPVGVVQVHAVRRGDDLHVSWDLFDAMHEIFDTNEEPDRPDPEGINKEVCELGEMLTATQLPCDHERFVSIVSRLIVLFGKSDVAASMSVQAEHDGACKGIEVQPGEFSGCSGKADCPVCHGTGPEPDNKCRNGNRATENCFGCPEGGLCE